METDQKGKSSIDSFNVHYALFVYCYRHAIITKRNEKRIFALLLTSILLI